MHVTRKYIKQNEGFGDFWHDVFSPIQNISRQIEKKVLAPLIIDPILKPLAKIMPKITIAGHRYDLGGNQMLIKTTAGAVMGFAMAGPYGAIAGGLAANLQHGKPDILADLTIGAGVGAATGLALMYAPALLAPAAVTGGTGAVVAGAGGAGAGGGILATTAQALAVTSGGLALAQKTGVLPTKNAAGQLVDQSGNVIPESQFTAASMFTGGNVLIFIGLSALTVIGYVLLHNKNRDLSDRK